jgi:hypothetical protein
MNSRNHIMQGAIGSWMYTDVAGIDQQPGSAGYASLLLWPRVTTHEALPTAAGTLLTVRGPVVVRWENSTTAFSLAAEVPTNAVAEVRLPFPAGAALAALVATEGGAEVFAGGAYKPGVPGVTGAAVDAASGTLSVKVGAGAYAFALSGW